MRIGRRPVLLTLGMALMIILVYLVVVPTIVASPYLYRLDASLARARDSIVAVTSGPGVAIFQDPDITLAKRQELISRALKNLERAQTSLTTLERINRLPPLPGNGFAGKYHTAVVRAERTNNTVRQSRQILDQYARLLTYVVTYTSLQANLDQRLNDLNAVSDFSTSVGHGNKEARIAASIRADQKQLQVLTPPPDFAALQREAVQTLDQAAAGFEQLAVGLNRGADSHIDSSLASLEAATARNQVKDKELLVILARNSPILLQLAELPEKIEHAQGR